MGRATRPNRSRRSGTRSTAASTCSIPPTCTGPTSTRSWSVARSRGGARRRSSPPSSASCAIRPIRTSASSTAHRRTCASPARAACAVSVSRRSICTICTGSTRACRSRKRSARWPNSWPPVRCAISACPRSAPRPCGARMRCTRSVRCKASIRCGRAIPRARSSIPAASSASPWSPTARSDAAS